MRILLLSFFVFMVAGCARQPTTSDVVRSLRFRVDPLNHQNEEAIEQIEITARPALVYRIGQLPHDWEASTNTTSSFKVTCLLTSGHTSFTVPNIHAFDGLIYLRLPACGERDFQLSAKIWLTRGPTGQGRVVKLNSQQLILE